MHSEHGVSCILAAHWYEEFDRKSGKFSERHQMLKASPAPNVDREIEFLHGRDGRCRFHFRSTGFEAFFLNSLEVCLSYHLAFRSRREGSESTTASSRDRKYGKEAVTE